MHETPLLISPPKITDELANLTPEIYNIELLNVEKLDHTLINSNNVEIEKFPIPALDKIDVPGIDNLFENMTESFSIPIEEMLQADVQFYSPSFEIAHPVFKVKIDIPRRIKINM